MASVSQIIIYPLKSGAPILLDQCTVNQRGMKNDRRWMLIEPSGKCITAREFPALLTFVSEPKEDGIIIKSCAGELVLALPGQNNEKIMTDIFSSTCQVTLVSKQADQWFSDQLKSDCRLVYMRPEDVRVVEPAVGGLEGDVVSFADENPLLLTTEASLAQLNSRLENPVKMNNFRPNIVVSGTAGFEEDNWNEISIGDAKFRVSQACKRCKLTTIDPDEAKFRGDGEPLKTLAKFRYDRDKSGVMFGIHLVPLDRSSQINIDDRLSVID